MGRYLSTDFRQFETYLNVTGLDVCRSFEDVYKTFLIKYLDGGGRK